MGGHGAAALGLAKPFNCTKDVPLLKVPVIERSPMYNNYGPGAMLESDTRLYDLDVDPGQEKPTTEAEAEARMTGFMRALMAANDAPPEAFERLKFG